MLETLGWFLALVFSFFAVWFAVVTVSRSQVKRLLSAIKDSRIGRSWTSADWNQVRKDVRKSVSDDVSAWSVFKEWYKEEIGRD